MNILNIFSDKKDVSSNDQTASNENGLYKIGWIIHLKSSGMITKMFPDVNEPERAEVYNRVLEEIKTMEIKLKDSIIQEDTFVNLFGNIVRVDQIEMITIKSGNLL
jgi:hypothetical protein